MRYLLNGGWEFAKAAPGTGYEAARELTFTKIDLPHDWLIGDSEKLYEDGDGWYRRALDWHGEGSHAFLTCEGIYMDSRIYVNGEAAFEWKYGYSSFTVDLAGYLREGANEIAVQVVFRSPNSRWYSGAGIYRNVWLTVTGPVYLPENGIYISTARDGEDWLVTASAEIMGEARASGSEAAGGAADAAGRTGDAAESGETDAAQASATTRAAVSFRVRDLSGQELPTQLISTEETTGPAPFIQSRTQSAQQRIEEGTTRERVRIVTQVLRVQGAKAWSPESPNLYLLECELRAGAAPAAAEENSTADGSAPQAQTAAGTVLQTECVRFGLRTVTFDPEQGFLLNGKNRKLNGVCEHHDLGSLGAAFYPDAMRRKLRTLRSMGVNAIRLTHNMAAPAVLDLADEMGFLLISEAFDMWELPKTEYDYARFFKDWHAIDVESWVRRDRNHPSVILWSIGNEIYDTHADAHGQEITADLAALVALHDPRGNARATIGSNYMPWEGAQRCADILKLAGYNYSEHCYEPHHAEHPDWVIYGSETASIPSSRGVYHFPLSAKILSDDDEQCSALGNSATSWGAESLEKCCCVDRDLPFSMGQFLWTGFDYIGEPTPYHTKNSYFGQIDTAGFFKDNAWFWKSVWTDAATQPMVHIAVPWDFNPGQRIDVRVYTNAPQAELFLNGRSLGRRTLTHAPGSGETVSADYSVIYEPGILGATALAEDGTILARTERTSFGDSAALTLRCDRTAFRAGTCDLAFVTIRALDKAGRFAENAADRVTVSVSGAGRLVGLDNGDSTDFDSYKANCRRLFNGCLLAVIAPRREAGPVYVRVSAPGLESAELVLAAEEAGQTGSAPESAAPLSLAALELDPTAAPLWDERTLLFEEANGPRKILTGCADEIPVRRIALSAPGGQQFNETTKELTAFAQLLPENADDREVSFSVVDVHGVLSNLAVLEEMPEEAESAGAAVQTSAAEGEAGQTAADAKGAATQTATVSAAAGPRLTCRIEPGTAKKIRIRALGDGQFLLRAESKSGSAKVRLISQLEFAADGLGVAYRDPYEFVAGSLVSDSIGETGPGNEKGIATGREGETVLIFRSLDFGTDGSDEITIPIFALNADPYPVEIWEGVPGEAGSRLLAQEVYCLPSIWNVYQSVTWKLNARLTGLKTISMKVRGKIHVKGFAFTRGDRAREELRALEADNIYGDTFTRGNEELLGIGNNVAVCFDAMRFGEAGISRVTICGRAPEGKNTIHVRFRDEAGKEARQIVEFPQSTDWTEHTFELEPVCGTQDVIFFFMPGSCFDFRSFRFS